MTPAVEMRGNGRWRVAVWVVLLLAFARAGARPAAADDAAPAGGAPAPHPVDDPLDDDAEAVQVWDPAEPLNRRMLRFNQNVDRWLVGPVTGAYAFVVPKPGRLAVRRFLLNLESPAIFANDVLQLAPLDAMITLQRFAVNTTVGLAGLFDPAGALGLPRHHTDFGQTLAIYGVAAGPYVILPVLGPTTARHGAGYVVDFLFQPTTYILPGITLFIYAGIHQGGAGLVAFEEHADQLHALQASSVDYYAALRSAYYQDRRASIEARRHHGPRAIARLLGALSLRSSGGEVGDPARQHVVQGGEAVALEY